MKKIEEDTTTKPTRRPWARRDWDTLLQLLQLLATLYAILKP